MTAQSETELLGQGGSESPVLRVEMLADKRTVVLLRAPGETSPSSWYVLQPNETLVTSHITPTTSVWFKNRTGVTLPTGDGQLFVYDEKQESIRAILPSTDSLARAQLGYSATLHGVTEAREGHHADTEEILKQKRARLPVLASLAQAEVAKRHGVSLGQNGDEDIYLVPVTQEMVVASQIAGDPCSADFREPKPLLKPGGLLLVKMGPQGKVIFAAESAGKAKSGSPNDLSKFPVGSTTLKDCFESIVLPGVPDGPEKKRQVERIRAHLVKHLLVDATSHYPTERTLPGRTVAQLITIEERKLPSSLQTYLQNQLPTLVAAERTRQEGKPFHVGGLTESVIEAYYLVPEAERLDFLVKYAVLETQIPRLIEDLERKAGFASLGETAADVLTDMYKQWYAEWGSLTQPEVETRIATIVDPLVRQRAEAISASLRKRLSSGSAGKAIARHLTAAEFDERLLSEGRRYFEKTRRFDSSLQHVVMPDEEAFFARAYERAERLLIPSSSYQRLIALQQAMFAAHNPGKASAVYRTPFFDQVADELRKAGFPDAAKIPWMNAESYAEVHHRKQFEQFAMAVGIATDVARSLSTDPHQFALDHAISPGSPAYTQVMELAGMIQATMQWNLPDFLPKPTDGRLPKQFPLLMTRPDLARRVNPNTGEIAWVATELENSPGGLGMQLVIMAAHPELRSTLVDHFRQFMKEAAVPKGVNRNNLTIVMTEEWEPYRTELQVFLDVLAKAGIHTKIVSIEELARSSDVHIDSGFVFHFAYTWNFMKEPSTYYQNLLHDPQRVADALGVPLDRVLQEKFRGNAQRGTLVHARDKILADGDDFFQRELRLPTEQWREQLLNGLYDQDILQMRSTHPSFAGLTLQEVGARMAQDMIEAAKQIYTRQGNDLAIFNDPYMGGIINGKTDMAVMHLPGFSETLQHTLASDYGFSSQEAASMANLLKQMTARTIPVATRASDRALREYAQRALDEARGNKNGWILKVSADPQFGAVDWGARGLIRGSDHKQAEWEQLLQKAAASDMSWVLQEVVPNVTFDQSRTDTAAQPIDLSGRREPGFYWRDPNSAVFHVGELVATPAMARYNPFLFSYRTNDGRLMSLANPGIVTLTPHDDDQVARAVHGSSNAAMVGATFVD